MASAWGAWQCQYNYKDWRGGVNAWVVSENDDTAIIRVEARYNSPYARQVNTTYAYTNCDGNNSGWVGTGGLNQPSNTDTTLVRRSQDYTVSKVKDGRNVWCAGGVQIGGTYSPGTSEAGVNVWVGARKYYAHGKPSVSVSSNHCEVGGKVTVSWKKSGTQGNANFERFELWQGNTKLYSGSNTSYQVTPSSVTGSKGGSVTYKVKEIHEWYSTYPETSNSVSVAVRGPHGTPTLSASKTTANYGESVNLSWSKSSTQGNAAFARFELWQGNSKLYSGSALSKSVVPSNATGAKGGTATYVLKEIHEWYGSYPSTQTSKSITVRSGVVSAYDSSGKKHTGLVTAYDSNGKSHYVLITAYDSSGKAHSVV